MPVLGTAVSSTLSGLVKRGVYLPAGSLDVWRAARDNAANALTEVAIFGDSTTFGSATGTPNLYSWVQKLRALSIAAGYTDGGRGIAGLSDTAGLSGPENIPIVQSMTPGGSWVAAGDGLDVLLTETPKSTANNATIVLQGYGVYCRLHYTKYSGTGSFTYAIDGGSPVTVNTNLGSGFSAGSVLLTLGGTDTTLHTVTVKNTNASTPNEIRVVGEFLKSKGIVYHKHAISGITSGSFFGRMNPSLGNYAAQVALGLTPGISGGANDYGWGQAVAAKPAARNVSLAIFPLGINNLQGLSVASDGLPTDDEQDAADRAVGSYEDDIANFVRLTRAAGADPMVVVPHFDMAAKTHTWGGQFARAAWSAGVSEGCAVVDFNEAIRPVSTMSARTLGAPNVHADYRTYDAEAAFIWTNALSL